MAPRQSRRGGGGGGASRIVGIAADAITSLTRRNRGDRRYFRGHGGAPGVRSGRFPTMPEPGSRSARGRRMRIRNVLDVFHDEVPAAFAFLTDRHRFQLERDDDARFTAHAPHADVTIELDWGSIVVSIRPAATGRPVRLSFVVGAKN